MARSRYRPEEGPVPLKRLPAAALRAALKEGYGRADLKADVMAGAVVGVVALPLAMALAIAVGAAPQHGLYTAIVAGLFTALLGGSRTNVSGPTAAFIVILAPIFAKHGLGGLLVSGMLAGVLLILMGLLRLGRLIEFVPHPVTTGFTAGIATVIATLQIKDLLGLRLAGAPDHFVERLLAMFEARHTANFWELGIGALTFAILLLFPRKVTTRVPAALAALPIAAIVVLLLDRLVPGFEVATVASRFQTKVGDVIVRGVPALPPLPALPWSWPGPDGHPVTLGWQAVRELFSGAFAIAMLGAIESLLSAVVADGMARTKHDPDAEILAIGVGNLLAPFFGGIPATGAIARTATNIRSGARSPIAAIVHAVVVLGAVVLLAPLINYLPMTSLAALLLLVAWNMSEVKHALHVVRVAPRADVAVLLTCYGLTVVFDMVIAVSVGIVLAALLFMRRMAEVTRTRLVDGALAHLDRPLPRGVVVYDISGPLFFGAAQKAMGALGLVDDRVRVVVLRMEAVPAMDATGLVALESALRELQRRGCVTVLCGLQAQPRELIGRAQLLDRPGVLVRDDLGEALQELEPVLSAPGRGTSGALPAVEAPPGP
jgi:SulP family sulfate permease